MKQSIRFYFYCSLSLWIGAQTANQPLWAAESENVKALPNQTQTENNWPRWRGVHSDGISAEDDWSADWSDSGPTVRWETNIGIGFSSFSILNGRLYTMGSVEDADVSAALADSEEVSTEQNSENTKKFPRKDVICASTPTPEKSFGSKSILPN